MTAGLILLAAGGSHRLGQPKQMLPYRGQTLLRRAAQAAAGSVCRPIMVVLGAQAEKMRPELSGLPTTIVKCADWQLGMGASLRAGLHALMTLADDPDGVVLAVCDQPALSAGVIDNLVESAARSDALLAASEYGGTLGVPALFRRALFAELAALDPAHGAKPLLQKYAAQAARVPFAGGAFDIDWPTDLEKLA